MSEEDREVEPAKATSLLGFNPLGRVIDVTGVEEEFRLIRAEVEKLLLDKEVARVRKTRKADLEKAASDDIRNDIEAEILVEAGKTAQAKIDETMGAAETYGRIASQSGNYLLKMVNPKASTRQGALRIGLNDSERNRLMPSVNAGDITVAKIIFRPLEIPGERPKSLVDHIISPDKNTGAIKHAFAKVFGQASLGSLQEGLEGSGDISELPPAEFPIVYLPGSDGEDIQVTPLSLASSYVEMRKLRGSHWVNPAAGGKPTLKGRWHAQEITSQLQNVSGALGGSRYRFLSTMPKVLDNASADIMRFANGGGFPSWGKPGIAGTVLHYAAKLEDKLRFRNSGTDRYLDGLAEDLVSGALSFISEIMEEAGILAIANAVEKTKDGVVPAARVLHPPTPGDLILRRYWKEGSRDIAMKVLDSPHFKAIERDTIQKKGR